MGYSNITRARCAQCGRELKHVPFNVKNIVCKECYGLDRYRRAAGAVVEKHVETTTSEEEPAV